MWAFFCRKGSSFICTTWCGGDQFPTHLQMVWPAGDPKSFTYIFMLDVLCPSHVLCAMQGIVDTALNEADRIPHLREPYVVWGEQTEAKRSEYSDGLLGRDISDRVVRDSLSEEVTPLTGRSY